MDCCRNISISGGLPSEYQPEQLLSSSCSKLGSLDDLFSSNNMEEEGGDVSLEWLSIFVEDCFSSSGNYSCLPPVGAAPPPNELQNTTTDIIATAAASMPPLLHSAEKTQQNTTSTTTSSLLQKKKKKKKFVVPISKARSKRKRGPVVTNKYSKTQQVTSSYWSHQAHIPLEQNFPLIMTSSSSDPPLLQQAYWLADSELLILPMKEQNTSGGGGGGCSRRSRSEIYRGGKQEGGAEDEEEVVQEDEEDNKRRGSLQGSKGQQKQQQPRRCSHCLAQRTPQWRAGPLGPKTLCNACGVRYKSGRLLPEYRPAKSPTFVTYKHSNSHKKVMEMRMAI